MSSKGLYTVRWINVDDISNIFYIYTHTQGSSSKCHSNRDPSSLNSSSCSSFNPMTKSEKFWFAIEKYVFYLLPSLLFVVEGTGIFSFQVYLERGSQSSYRIWMG